MNYFSFFSHSTGSGVGDLGMSLEIKVFQCFELTSLGGHFPKSALHAEL